MDIKANIQLFWALGLSGEQCAQLERCLGSGQKLHAWRLGAVPGVADLEAEKPFLLFVSGESQRALADNANKSLRHLRILPKIFVMHDGYSQAELEEAVDSDALDILRPPFNRKALAGKLSRVADSVTIHQDIVCMTKEILLEREILERKNSIMEFMVNFLTITGDGKELYQILQNSFKGLSMLLPAHNMHAALWYPNTRGENTVELFIASEKSHPAFGKWRETLLDQGQKYGLPATGSIAATPLVLSGRGAALELIEPNAGNVIYLPLKCGETCLGFLAVMTSMKKGLGRDQAQALDSAIRHLSVSLENAIRVQELRTMAEYDSLTGLHNRRYLEGELKKEHARTLRYDVPFSVIFADIDHFKKINDSKGHKAGDQVLRQIADIFKSKMRVTETYARYGGEEFVMLLPHTTSAEAAVLAERIRSSVNEHVFSTDSGPLKVSISLGLASMDKAKAVEKNACSTILHQADKALYEAKNSGRNCVRISEEECLLAAY